MKEELLLSLENLTKKLVKVRSIEETELLEKQWKQIVRDLVNSFSDHSDVVFSIAHTQMKMGLILKVKSYGIKACTPLGYALFLLKKNHGFSFQNHLDFKVELFHILNPYEKGYVYLSSYKDWLNYFDKNLFEHWFLKKKQSIYDRYCYFPKIGDVLKIEKTGIVHTAIGCVLEEYANDSTDCVLRLFDQNKGKKIPKKINRKEILQKIKQIEFPQKSQNIQQNSLSKTFIECNLAINKYLFGFEILLHHSSEFEARRFIFENDETYHFFAKKQYHSIFVSDGEFEIVLVNKEKLQRLFLKKGDVSMFVPFSQWEIRKSNSSIGHFSLLSIDKEKAMRI